MGENLLEALTLLIVGMGSAFFVLFLIGVIGQFLITWTNYQAENRIIPKNNVHRNPAHIAVITAAVEQVTEGEGRISNIQKIEL
jgi:oxaloacetate decarboxylase gamma subunit